MTWVLVLALAMSSGSAMTNIPHYASEQACHAAGNKYVTAAGAALWRSGYICLPMDKP